MTDAQRRIAIQKLIEKHTAEHTTSKAAARKSLIEEGIYTKRGALRAEFGGSSKRGKTAA